MPEQPCAQPRLMGNTVVYPLNRPASQSLQTWPVGTIFKSFGHAFPSRCGANFATLSKEWLMLEEKTSPEMRERLSEMSVQRPDIETLG